MPLTPVLALSLAVAAIWLFTIGLSARHQLHMLQLEEYDNLRLARWAGSQHTAAIRPWRWLAFGIAALLVAATLASLSLIAVVLLVLWLVPAILIAIRLRPHPAKKRLAYTQRMRRIIVATLIILFTLSGAVAVLTFIFAHGGNGLATTLLAPALPVVVLLLLDYRLIIAANLVAHPIEQAVQRRYVKNAHARVRQLSPTLIGITGSFGKTTTKEILATILSTRFRTLKTPESWNTLMGLTRTIRERLDEQHEIFVVEMGAYKRGEIAALCDLTGPLHIGILTGINEQHLERFGGIENTIKAKYEIIQAIQPGGLAIFNVDNAYCRRLAEQTAHARVMRVGLGPESGPLDLTARDIAVSPSGTRFTLMAGGSCVPCRTQLLGEHFILNVLMATAAALECGMTLQQIASAVAATPPVPHRLQILPGPDGITTIDDAYSANPDGARAALKILSRMQSGRRILVTPGFVELGDQEVTLNRSLGEQANAACDILVLVGPRRTAPIREGALSSGMDGDRIHVVSSIIAAREFLASIAKPGDTVLFENDLPDNYDE